MSIKDTIFEKVTFLFKHHTKTDFGGVIKGLAMCFSTALEDIYLYGDQIKKDMFLTSCSEEALYLHAGRRYPPKTGRKAVGLVYFYGGLGDTVPKDTLLNGDKKYITLEEGIVEVFRFTGVAELGDEDNVVLNTNGTVPSCKATIDGVEVDVTAEGDNIYFQKPDINEGDEVILEILATNPVRVECLEIGEDGNVEFNNTLTTETILDVNSEAKVIKIEGGENEETTEQYRQRVLQLERTPQPPYSAGNIIFFLKQQCSFLKEVWVKTVDKEIHIIVINEKLGLETYQQEIIEEVHEFIRPVTVDKERIKIMQPTLKSVPIKIKNIVPNIEELKDNVEANLRSFFDDYHYETPITHLDLTRVIMQTTRGIDKITAFEILAGTIDAETNTLFTFGGVTFEL